MAIISNTNKNNNNMFLFYFKIIKNKLLLCSEEINVEKFSHAVWQSYLFVFPHLSVGTMATSQMCCHLTDKKLESAAECADRARIHLVTNRPVSLQTDPSSTTLQYVDFAADKQTNQFKLSDLLRKRNTSFAWQA
jgi:hypothetical protein